MSSTTQKIGLNRFDVRSIPPSCTWVVVGPPASGKTTLMANFAFELRDRIAVAGGQFGTETALDYFNKKMHPLYTSYGYDEKHLEGIKSRQRKCVMDDPNRQDASKAWAGNYCLTIVDDVTEDKKILNKPLFQSMYKNGSQHWAQIFMLGLQYAIDLPTAIRRSTSYVALGRETNPNQLEKLYNNFGGPFGSREDFDAAMKSVAQNHTFLIIKMRSQSNEVKDNVFWYKTTHPDDMEKAEKGWKVGCPQYWKWGDDRMNESYVESVI